MLILLWGVPEERPLAAVAKALHRSGADFVLVNQRHVLRTRVTLTVGEQVTGVLSLPGSTVPLEEVGAAYIRPYDSRQLPAVCNAGNSTQAERCAVAVDQILFNWCELTAAVVVNRPRDSASNGCKPYQARIIRQLGFKVPKTLITTTRAAALDFHEQQGGIIYKSISGIRSRVTRLTPAHADRLADVACCPTQFQEFLPGRDFRVHVVGSEVFGCEIDCDADDYRYPGDHPVTIRAAKIPSDIEERCLSLVRRMGLFVAGVDLRRTPSGEWCCFEVNPSPAFTFYEESSEQPIAAAIASLLISAAHNWTSERGTSGSDAAPAVLGLDRDLNLAPAVIWEA